MKPKYILAVVMAVSFVLNVIGISWGLPSAERNRFYPQDKSGELAAWVNDYYQTTPINSYHPDERLVMAGIFNLSLRPLNLNPGRFEYPSLNMYIAAAAMTVASWFGQAHLTADLNYYVANPEQMARLYVIGRLSMAAFGTLTLLWLYLIGVGLGSAPMGLLAASLLAILPAWVRDSHFLMINIPMGCWVAAACWAFLMMYQQPQRRRWYVLSGIAVGLATASKYPAAPLLMVPIMVHFYKVRRPLNAKNRVNLYVVLLAAFFAFFMTSPFVLLRMGEAKTQIAVASGSISTIQVMNLVGAAVSVGLPMTALIIFALAWLVRRSLFQQDAIASGLLIVLAILLFVPLTSLYPSVRYMVPAFPVLAFCVAYCLFNLPKGRLRHVVWSATVIIMGITLFYALLVDRAMVQPEPEIEAARWIAQNVPAGSSIAVTLPIWYAQPIVDNTRYQLADVRLLNADDPPYLIVAPIEPLTSFSASFLTDYYQIGKCRYQAQIFEVLPVPQWLAPIEGYLDDWTYTLRRQRLWLRQGCTDG